MFNKLNTCVHDLRNFMKIIAHRNEVFHFLNCQKSQNAFIKYKVGTRNMSNTNTVCDLYIIHRNGVILWVFILYVNYYSLNHKKPFYRPHKKK